MQTPALVDGQFVDGTLLNQMVAQFMVDFGMSGSALHTPGLLSPASLTFTPSALTVLVQAPAPFAVLFGNGLVVQANGAINGALSSSTTVSFASLVPGAGSITAYIAASYIQIGQQQTQVVGPPVGHPDFDPNFAPFQFFLEQLDSLNIFATVTPPNNTTVFELGRITLTAGQSTITPPINTANWHYASSVLNPTGVTAGSYAFSSITVGADGRVTSAATGNPFPATGVTPGAYPGANVTVEADGRITAISSSTYPGRLLGPPQEFTTSGTYVPTPGMASVIFEVQGGGAAAAGAGGAAAGNVSLGAPGTSGAYAKGRFTAAQVGASQPVVVGAGGIPVSNGVGGDGGTSSVGALISAPGGRGGGLFNNAAPPTANGNGTVTSAPTGGNIVSAVGSPGFMSLALSVTLGLGGQGGGSLFGPGGSTPQINNSGVAAVNSGTGGAGCVLNTAGGNAAGGAGFRGIILAWEYS